MAHAAAGGGANDDLHEETPESDEFEENLTREVPGKTGEFEDETTGLKFTTPQVHETWKKELQNFCKRLDVISLIPPCEP